MNTQLLSFLSDLKAYGLEQDIPNVTERGGRFLNMMVKVFGAKEILEIGTANGYSTIWMAEAARETSGHITTFDFSKPTFEEALENFKKTGFEDVITPIFGRAQDKLKEMDEEKKFDFVFVDGQKKSYLDFWQLVRPRLQSRCLVIFDDVFAFPKKTKPFLDHIKEEAEFDQIQIPLDGDDGILMLTRNA